VVHTTSDQRWSTVLCTRRRFPTIPVQSTSENDTDTRWHLVSLARKWDDDHVPHDTPERESKPDGSNGQDRQRTPADLRPSR